MVDDRRIGIEAAERYLEKKEQEQQEAQEIREAREFTIFIIVIILGTALVCFAFGYSLGGGSLQIW